MWKAAATEFDQHPRSSLTADEVVDAEFDEVSEEEPEMKPGLKTSEMWLTVVQMAVGFLLTLAASRGLLVERDLDRPAIEDQVEEIVTETDDVRSLVQGVLALGGLIVSGLAVGNYAKQRTELKASSTED